MYSHALIWVSGSGYDDWRSSGTNALHGRIGDSRAVNTCINPIGSQLERKAIRKGDRDHPRKLYYWCSVS